MATQIDSIPIVGMRKTHLKQLAAYIRMRDTDQWYYGNMKQFEKRHEDLLTLADHLDALADDKDIVIKGT